MRKLTTGLLAAIAALTGAATAEAAAITDPNILPILIADFNAIVDGQFNSGSDTEGPVLIGGVLGPGTVALNQTDVVLGTTPGTTAITGYGEVNVFGNHTAPFNNAMGNVFVGGPVAGTFPNHTSLTFNYAFPPGATPADNPATFQTNIWSKMTGFSAGLAGLTSPSTLSGSTFTGVANSKGVAVFNITLAQLNAVSGTLSFAGCLASATPCDAVVNVTGAGPFTQGFNYGALTSAQQNLIWNFENATDVNVNGEWFASILAPDALVMNTAPIEGTLIAATYGGAAPLGSGELHYHPFDCSDNLCDLPEPGSLSVFAAALAAFGAIRRRRG
jgi:choice-of-anchor A domain-containing protein